jgi:CRISPR-associated Csx2 family protein
MNFFVILVVFVDDKGGEREMRRVFLSFLGTNDYIPCTYYREDEGFSSESVRFVQEATLELCCRDWGKNDRILIFTTDEARKRNWEDNGQFDGETKKPRQVEGLRSRVEALDLSASVDRVDIPHGQSEAEIWDIFEKVFEQLREADHVIFDITHAFRSIPMLAVVILNYAKVMKAVVLDGIYYGAFEVLGSIHEARKLPLEKRRAPILDLTAFDQLMDWTTAIDRFTEAGDARSIHQLAMKNIRPILSESRGQDESARRIRSMAGALLDYTKALTTCRGPEISNIGSRLRGRIGECKEIDLIRPLHPLFARISEQASLFQGDIVTDGIQAAKWCLRHNLVQQGVTILRELVFSCGLVSIGADPQDVTTREIASQAMTIVIRKLMEDEDQWYPLARENKDTTRKLIVFFKENPDLVKTGDSLGQLRNDMNHAGFRPHARKVKDADGFSRALESAIVSIEECVGQLSEPLQLVQE